MNLSSSVSLRYITHIRSAGNPLQNGTDDFDKLLQVSYIVPYSTRLRYNYSETVVKAVVMVTTVVTRNMHIWTAIYHFLLSYCAPGCRENNVVLLTEGIDYMFDASVVLCGEFNISHIDWYILGYYGIESVSIRSSFIDCSQANALDKSTTRKNNILDLVFINGPFKLRM